jgi:hypothetical protein
MFTKICAITIDNPFLEIKCSIFNPKCLIHWCQRFIFIFPFITNDDLFLSIISYGMNSIVNLYRPFNGSFFPLMMILCGHFVNIC